MEIDNDHLELRIDETWVPAEEFRELFKDFLGLVSEVADTVTKKKDAFHWLVAVEKGSSVMRFQPQPRNAPADSIPIALTTIDNGLEELVIKGTRPVYFNNKALSHVYRISKHSRKDDKPSERISALGPQNQKRSFKNLESIIDTMLAKHTEAWGSITGKLLVVSGRKGESFTIDDELTGKSVVCSLPTELSQMVIDAFRSRVRVEGKIKYSSDGHPTSIRIDSDDHVKVLKEQAQLPSFKDVLGIHNRAG